jgi:signal transduction histidine kinase
MLSVLVMTYTVVSYCSPRDAAIGTGMVVVSASLQVWLGGQSWDNLAFILTFVGIFWAFGRIVRIRSAQAVESELRAERLQLEHSERARRIVTEERARIARELHDVIAHSVSVMVVQAGAAQQVLRDDPRMAEEALETVQRTGRESIRELGGLLGILREDSAEIGFDPQPKIAELPRLIEDARTAGVAVELITEGEAIELPAGVELAVYRVVQEALTNIRKHAGASPTATVRLAYGPGDVHIEVTDDGPGEGVLAAYGTGHGLVGIRERVTGYGGTLAAGGEADRGYRISARIPIGAAE